MSNLLEGLTVLEFRGRAPVDFAGYLLADLGAQVISIEPVQADGEVANSIDLLQAGRKRISLNLKSKAAQQIVYKLASKIDVLIEGFRPGVMERLGLGPTHVRTYKPNIVYARITGYGQTGPYSTRAGHDLNYLALSGVLNVFGRDIKDPPAPPINLLADIGAGSILTVNSILAALYRRDRHGQGAVIDSSMVDGVSYMATHTHILQNQGSRGIPKSAWDSERGNILSGAAPFYDVYKTHDGKEVSVSCIERARFSGFLAAFELDPKWADAHDQRGQWKELRDVLTQRIREMTLEQLDELAARLDLDVAPVLSFSEMISSPHHQARHTFREIGNPSVTLPAPAPRVDGATLRDLRTERQGQSTREILRQLGYTSEDLNAFVAQRIIAMDPNADDNDGVLARNRT